MRRSILLLLFCALTGCAASQRAWTRKDVTPQQAFDAALERNDGKKAAYAVRVGHLDPEKARRAVLARATKLVQDDDVPAASSLVEDYGLDKPARVRYAQGLFGELVGDGMCIRAAEFAKALGLGARYGQAAVDCVRRGSPVEAAAIACQADVTDAYKEGLVREAWATLETFSGDDRFSGLELLLDSPCSLLEAPAKAWFPRTLKEEAGLRLGRIILDRASSAKWGWDLTPMYRELLKAAISFDAEYVAANIMSEGAFVPDDSDFDLYIGYQTAHLRCQEAAALVLERALPKAKAEAIFSEPKCAGAAFDGLAWNIKEQEAPWWFDLALRHGKFRLARKLADKLKDPKPAIEKLETAAFDAGDFDAVMDFPTRDGETVDRQRERVLQAALDRGDEWFVVRWNIYGQNQVEASRRDGWIERAYLHALLRKDWMTAAFCIAEHSVQATAASGERLAFEEALLAEDADAAIDLARVYKLGDDCRKRAALLKARKIQEEERAKAKAAAKKKRRKAHEDWNP